MSSTLLVINCGWLVTLDGPRRILRNGWLLARERRIPGLDLPDLLARHGRIAQRITGGV